MTLSIFAPAKINLYLHVTGRRSDGYHLLDSLVVFADIGDHLTIEEAPDFSFMITGPYATAFTAQEKTRDLNSDNLVVQAAYAMAKAADRPLDLRITLQKNLPLKAGIGGGSSDAAAILWGLMEWWDLPNSSAYMPGIMQALGADVPVCFHCKPAHVQGIGDILERPPSIPEIPILLVKPEKHCDTSAVFKNYNLQDSPPLSMPDQFDTARQLIDFLKNCRNDLTESALQIAPDIACVLDVLNKQKNILLARMSGSGSSCYALFETIDDCEQAAEDIKLQNPNWWVRSGTINRPERY